jgi:hypothetical protein
MRNAAEDVPLFHDFRQKGVVCAIMVSFAQNQERGGAACN